MNAQEERDVVAILEASKGDDLYRAESAFKNCTAQDMRSEYGQSGKTRQQILDEYRAHNQRIDKLIRAVKASQ